MIDLNNLGKKPYKKEKPKPEFKKDIEAPKNLFTSSLFDSKPLEQKPKESLFSQTPIFGSSNNIFGKQTNEETNIFSNSSTSIFG